MKAIWETRRARLFKCPACGHVYLRNEPRRAEWSP